MKRNFFLNTIYFSNLDPWRNPEASATPKDLSVQFLGIALMPGELLRQLRQGVLPQLLLRGRESDGSYCNKKHQETKQ